MGYSSKCWKGSVIEIKDYLKNENIATSKIKQRYTSFTINSLQIKVKNYLQSLKATLHSLEWPACG